MELQIKMSEHAKERLIERFPTRHKDFGSGSFRSLKKRLRKEITPILESKVSEAVKTIKVTDREAVFVLSRESHKLYIIATVYPKSKRAENTKIKKSKQITRINGPDNIIKMKKSVKIKKMKF